jgi:hypothetical protein
MRQVEMLTPMFRFGRLAALVLTGAVSATAPHRTHRSLSRRADREQRVRRADDIRPIDAQAFDEQGWTKEVKAMIDKGAEVKAADVPVIVDYLTRYRSAADGPGKEVVLNVCTQCRSAARPRAAQRGGMVGSPDRDAERRRAAHRQGLRGGPALSRRNFRPSVAASPI